MPIAVEYTKKCCRTPIGGVHLDVCLKAGVLAIQILIAVEVTQQVGGAGDEIGAILRAFPLQGSGGRGGIGQFVNPHRNLLLSPIGNGERDIGCGRLFLRHASEVALQDEVLSAGEVGRHGDGLAVAADGEILRSIGCQDVEGEEFLGLVLRALDVALRGVAVCILSRIAGGRSGLHVVAVAGLGDGEGQLIVCPDLGRGLQRHFADGVGQGRVDGGRRAVPVHTGSVGYSGLGAGKFALQGDGGQVCGGVAPAIRPEEKGVFVAGIEFERSGGGAVVEGEAFRRAFVAVVDDLHQQAADLIVVRLADGAGPEVFQAEGDSDGLRIFAGRDGFVVVAVARGQQKQGEEA